MTGKVLVHGCARVIFAPSACRSLFFDEGGREVDVKDVLTICGIAGILAINASAVIIGEMAGSCVSVNAGVGAEGIGKCFCEAAAGGTEGVIFGCSGSPVCSFTPGSVRTGARTCIELNANIAGQAAPDCIGKIPDCAGVDALSTAEVQPRFIAVAHDGEVLDQTAFAVIKPWSRMIGQTFFDTCSNINNILCNLAARFENGKFLCGQYTAFDRNGIVFGDELICLILEFGVIAASGERIGKADIESVGVIVANEVCDRSITRNSIGRCGRRGRCGCRDSGRVFCNVGTANIACAAGIINFIPAIFFANNGDFFTIIQTADSTITGTGASADV